jgi:electron transfer flavoprotein alpha subunit
MTVLVLVETDENGVAEVSAETLTLARGVGGELHALLVGEDPGRLLDQLGSYGVTTLHHAGGDAFSAYAAAAWAAAA